MRKSPNFIKTIRPLFNVGARSFATHWDTHAAAGGTAWKRESSRCPADCCDIDYYYDESQRPEMSCPRSLPEINPHREQMFHRVNDGANEQAKQLQWWSRRRRQLTWAAMKVACTCVVFWGQKENACAIVPPPSVWGEQPKFLPKDIDQLLALAVTSSSLGKGVNSFLLKILIASRIFIRVCYFNQGNNYLIKHTLFGEPPSHRPRENINLEMSNQLFRVLSNDYHLLTFRTQSKSYLCTSRGDAISAHSSLIWWPLL